MSTYIASMGWQAALVVACVILVVAAVLVIAIEQFTAWHDRNFRRIRREDLISHRVTPRLPFGDWK